MIKLLKKYQVQVTPFAATKDWTLNNNDNDNLLLFESTGSDDGLPFALEFIDYGDGTDFPVDNNLCDIALEQQTNDLATTEIGLNVQGIVYPETEPTNDDGTYQRSIYHQVETMFYNTYLDPSKIWGLEQIDFQISQTKRLLSDKFRLIDVPRTVYGEKMVPKSVVVYDNTLDNPYQIRDDGNGNLFAGVNLFSHQQELGEYVNEFISDLTASYCDYYWNHTEPVHYDSASVTMMFFGGNIEEQLRIDTASVSLGFVYGGLQNYVYPEYASVTMTFGSGSIVETTTPIFVTESSPYVSMSFDSGYITDTTQTRSVSDAMSFTSMGFTSGSQITTTTVVTGSISGSTTGSFEHVNVSMAFISGTRLNTTTVLTMSFNQVTNSIAFYSGFIA